MPSPPPLPSAVSSTPAAPTVVPHQARTCHRCGSPLDPGDRFCQACGQDNETAADVVATDSTVSAKKFLRCNNCGAEIAVDPAQRSYTCPFCDSNYVIEFQPE